MAISETALQETLAELHVHEFDWIVDASEIVHGIIPNRLTPQDKRAKLLIAYFLDTYGSLRRLYDLTYRVTPLNVMRD